MWPGLAWPDLAWLWKSIDRYDRLPISQSAGGPDHVTCQVERWRVSEQKGEKEGGVRKLGGKERREGISNGAHKYMKQLCKPHVYRAWVTCTSVREALHYKKAESLRMTNVYPKNLWLDQGLRGCRVSDGKQTGDRQTESGRKRKRLNGRKSARRTVNECQTAQAGRQSGKVGGIWQTHLTQADSSINSPRMAALIDS